MILYKEGATQAQEDEAHAILEALTFAYPGHPWGVRVYDGGFFIRHLDFDANWGMNCKHGTKTYSASALKRQVILMAGEWLERAGLRRGMARDGEETGLVEGVPEAYQPKELKPALQPLAVVGAEVEALRTTPMPQSVELARG